MTGWATPETVRTPMRAGERLAVRLMLTGALLMLGGAILLPLGLTESIVGALIEAGLALTLSRQPEGVRRRSAMFGAAIAFVSSMLTVIGHLQVFGLRFESIVAIAHAALVLGLFISAYVAVIRAAGSARVSPLDQAG